MGRKPTVKLECKAMRERLKHLGIDPPSLSKLMDRKVRRCVFKLLERVGGKRLPRSFDIVGDQVSCIVHYDGKRVTVRGRKLRMVEVGERCTANND